MSNTRKGIILAGGAGTRLYPLTMAVSKQLVPVYNKPMVYYPLSTLMLAGIREILLITTPHDAPAFQRLLGHGADLGLSIEYAVQERPNGIAEAFTIGRRFIGASPVALVLGDNLFYGHGLPEALRAATERAQGGTIFAYWGRDPERYGAVAFDAAGRAVAIQAKPPRPRPSWAVTGLYFYDARVVEIAAGLVPSARGELEITDVNAAYLRAGTLHVEKLGRGAAWLDTGTHEARLQSSAFIQPSRTAPSLMVACLEELPWRLGWIAAADVERIAKPMRDNAYG